MISKQKLYMVISIFFLTLAMVIYSYNGIIIPKKVSLSAKAVRIEFNKKQSSVFCVKNKSIEKGTLINEMNYLEFFDGTLIYSDGYLDVVSLSEIREGFYMNRDMTNKEILTTGDITKDIPEKDCDLYEIRIKNSFCGELRPGEIVDLIYIEGSKITVIAQKKQIKGLFGYTQSKYIKAADIKIESDAIVFVELTKQQFETFLSFENIYVRKTGEIIEY